MYRPRSVAAWSHMIESEVLGDLSRRETVESLEVEKALLLVTRRLDAGDGAVPPFAADGRPVRCPIRREPTGAA